MKFSCEKALLSEAIHTSMRAVASKSSMPALEGLLLHCEKKRLTVSGYNMNTGIRTTVEVTSKTEGKIVLSARLFGDIIRRMPDDVVTLTVDSKTSVAHVSCGDASFDIPTIPADDFPEIPEVEQTHSVSLPENTLKSMLNETLFAVSTDEARPVFMGSLFEVAENGLTIVSVDGFRLALRREKLEQVPSAAFSFVAPGDALGEVERICGQCEDTVTITLGSRHILFKTGNTELICRRLEGEFLDYRKAIPRNNSTLLKIETRRFLTSLDRVSVIINEKMKAPVRCLFSENTVTLSAKTAMGDSKDICRLDDGDGKGLEIGFNHRYLMEALRSVPAELVRLELSTNVSPVIIVPEDSENGEESFLYMILPVRLKAE